MKVIYKYELPESQTKCIIEMPEGAKVLTVNLQFNALCIWALVDITKPYETREFYVTGTGHPGDFSNQYKYIDTVQFSGGQYIYHIFEKLKEVNDKFIKLLKEFEEAVRQDAWKGGGHPDDMPSITKAYEEDKQNLIDYVKGLE